MYLGQDKLIRNSLIDIRHVPIEYRTIFLDQFSYVGDDLMTMSRQFSFFYFCHLVFSLMLNRANAIIYAHPRESSPRRVIGLLWIILMSREQWTMSRHDDDLHEPDSQLHVAATG